jgi:hypothetical protein
MSARAPEAPNDLHDRSGPLSRALPKAVTAWLKAAMVDALAPLLAPVPVEVKVGRTWGGD